MQAICNLLDAAMGGQINFDELAAGLQKNGIQSLSYDMLTGRHRFYTENGEVFDHHSRLEPARKVTNTFNQPAVVAAIAAFDRQEITATQFHEHLAHAGVVFCRCFEKTKRAIYLGADGDSYVEQW